MRHSLAPLNESRISGSAHEVRLFSIVRNEARRMPFFLRYYAAKGVDRFFIVDNDSTDGTAEHLLDWPRVHVYRARGTYSGSRYGIEWLEELLDRYGQGHWCVVADADEIFVYPDCEHLSIPDVCRDLDRQHASALHCLLVDMYSDRPFAETTYVAGSDPLSVCRYFEADTIVCVGSLRDVHLRSWKHYGGMRMRVFGIRVRLDKISLLKYTGAMTLGPGMHSIVGGSLAARARGAVLHFKYFSDFHDRVTHEAARGEHWNNAVEYSGYSAVMSQHPRLSAYTPTVSRALQSSTDLIAAGIMLTGQHDPLASPRAIGDGAHQGSVDA